MKHVRETSDTRAWVVLDRKGLHVATVQARFTPARVRVDVWTIKPGQKHLSLTYQACDASRGRDRFAAALDGARIDGYRMADHCGVVEEKGMKQREKLMRAYRADPMHAFHTHAMKVWEPKLARIGAGFANWVEGEGFTAIHFLAGFGRIESLGYRVIQAV